MKTVSTLCATSTVGVAACGFALGRPSFTTGGSGRFDNTQFNSTAPSYTDSTSYSQSARESFTVPSTPISETHQQRPQTPNTKSWYRRLSTSFSSSSGSKNASTSSPTRTPQRSRESVSLAWAARPPPIQATSQPQPPQARPPTRNRLVKKSALRQLGPSPLTQPFSRPPTRRSLSSRRPATSGGKDSAPLARDRRHTINFSSRPATAAAASSSSSGHPHRFSLRASNSWTFLFRGKRSSKSGQDIRRIYPENRYICTLVSPHMITQDQTDRESIYSVSHSVYVESRPNTPMLPMGTVLVEERTTTTTTTTTTVALPADGGLKRSFSISNILSSASNRLPSRGSISRRRFSSSIMAEQSGTSRRPSSGYNAVSPPFSPQSPLAPRLAEPSEPVPSIPFHLHPQSPPLPSPNPALPAVASLHITEDLEDEVSMPLSPPPPTSSGRASASPAPSLPLSGPISGRVSKASEHPHRFSQASAAANSERASTLIGSDCEDDADDDASDVDFMSETVFDSMRTRNSETPMRADSIFESAIGSSQSELSPSSARLTVATKRELDMQSERSTGSNNQQPGLLRVSTIWSKQDSDGQSRGSWDGSDWDVGSSAREFEDARSHISSSKASHSGKSMIYPSSSLFSPLPNNGSRSSFASFGSALEDTDDEEDNADVTIRPQTSHLNFTSMLQPRPANLHVRSHSMPGKNTLGRGYVRALVSENWDDDFDDGANDEVIIPQAIEDKQISIVDHLSNIQNFAGLVEELKLLVQKGLLHKGLRYGKHRALWDEADGIIALATLQSQGENTPTTPTKSVHSGTSRLSISIDESPAPNLPLICIPTNSSSTEPQKQSRRKSILGDEEGIFGPTTQQHIPLRVSRTANSQNGDSPPRLAVRRTQTSPATPVSSSHPSAPTPTTQQADPVEVAKALIRKLKLSNNSSPTSTMLSPTAGKVDVDPQGKIHFDTSMLSDLVGRVNSLIIELEDVIYEREQEVEKEREMGGRGRSRDGVRPGSGTSAGKGKEQFDIEGRSLSVGVGKLAGCR